MILKVLIIGFGNIGKRYLQAIESTKLRCEVFIYDIDKKKYETQNKSKNIFFLKNLSYLPKKIDFCFFSSNSNKRFETIQQTFSYVKPKFIIIEKILSQSVKDLNKILNLFKNYKMLNKVWVNTHYRTYKIFQKVINLAPKKNIKSVEVRGTNWGLMCNSIHYIDLYSSILNSKISKIDTRNLEKKWVRSKRRGFFENYGELKIIFKNKKILKLSCKKTNKINKTNTYHIIKFKNIGSFKIHEEGGDVFLNHRRKFKFALEPVSKKMKSFILDIYNGNNCDLTNIKLSIEQHIKFVSELVKFWNKHHNKKIHNIKVT